MRIFLLFSLFVLYSVFIKIYSQEYYHYKGQIIYLTPRQDKIAFVLNSRNVNNNLTRSAIISKAGSGAVVKETGTNVLILVLDKSKSVTGIESMTNQYSSISGIKFIAKTYYGDSKQVTQVVTDEFVVKLKDKKDISILDKLNKEYNCSIIGMTEEGMGYIVKTNDNITMNALQLSDIYYNQNVFEYVEPNFQYPEFSLLNTDPNDPYFTSQWAIRNTGQTVLTEGSTTGGDVTSTNGIPDADMDVDLAWNYVTGTNVKIGDLDTGIDSTHPDLSANLLPGYDAYSNKNGVAKDSGSHGTCTAGLIIAVANNSIGVAGIAYGAKLMSIKIFNSAGSTTDAVIARGFDTARVRGLDVLNNSWGGGTPSSVITNAINNAALNGRGGKGCVILFSSGNDGQNPPSYPSYLDNVICVGASTPHDQKKAANTGNQFWWGGNWGQDANGDLDCVAPTVCYTTDVQGTGGYNTSAGTAGNYYATFNGTSCACPNATGVAALVLSVDLSQTRNQVKQNLLMGCDKIDNVPYSTVKTYGKWNQYTGYGRINAYNSVRLAAGIDVTPPTINYQQIQSHSSTRVTYVTAEILDQDGSAIPSTGINQPKLFFRYNKNSAGWSLFDSLTAVSIAGNNYTFAMPCFGRETEVQYYFRARDDYGNESTFPRGAPNTFWLCYYSVATYSTVSAKNSAFTIATSGTSVSSNFTVGNFKIINTSAKIYLHHTYVSDILVNIWGPGSDANNNRRCIFSHNGGSGQNIIGASVSDLATSLWSNSTPPYTSGLFLPEYPLCGFNGTSANGNWKILVYDGYSGDGGTCDSIVLTFTKTTGALSACARLNSGFDSTVFFGTVIKGSSLNRNFYLKNSGTSNLNIDSSKFIGTDASKFSLISSPSVIIPGDSGLFNIQCNNVLFKQMSNNLMAPSMACTLNIYNNDPSKNDFQVKMVATDSTASVPVLTLTALIQGLYNGSAMVSDTVNVEIHNASPSYTIIDSIKGVLNTAGVGAFTFTNAVNGTPYYLVIKHRNTIETWSATTQTFVSSSLSYDFTTAATQAYGSNMIQKGSKWCMYSGDVNHDGQVSFTDLIAVDNDNSNYVTGYKNTDLTGDNQVTFSDLLIVDNNNSNYISRQVPSGSLISRNINQQSIFENKSIIINNKSRSTK
jgi:subtilisin family serine protease